MTGFLKVFGKGVLYVVLLPFILLFLALMMVYLLISYIVMAIKSMIVFFMGGSPFGDLPEDIKAREIIVAAQEAAARQTQTVSNNTTTTSNDNSVTYNQNIFVNPNDLAAFLNSQASKNQNQQINNQGNINQVGQNAPQQIANNDPLFLESSDEKGGEQ